MRSKSIRAKRPKRADQERPFTIVGIDFLENDVLSCEERMIYIVLRSFLEDQNKTFGTVQVPMETIAAGASMSENRDRAWICKKAAPGNGKDEHLRDNGLSGRKEAPGRCRITVSL